MWGETFTVLRLRLMHKLAMPHISKTCLTSCTEENRVCIFFWWGGTFSGSSSIFWGIVKQHSWDFTLILRVPKGANAGYRGKVSSLLKDFSYSPMSICAVEVNSNDNVNHTFKLLLASLWQGSKEDQQLPRMHFYGDKAIKEAQSTYLVVLTSHVDDTAVQLVLNPFLQFVSHEELYS